MSKKDSKGLKTPKKYRPDLAGTTRYKGKEIADLVEEAARMEGKSVSAFQKDLVFDALEQRFGERFLEALEKNQKKYKKDRWRWIKKLRKKN